MPKPPPSKVTVTNVKARMYCVAMLSCCLIDHLTCCNLCLNLYLNPHSGIWDTNHLPDRVVKFTMSLYVMLDQHIAHLKGPFLRLNIITFVTIGPKP